MELLWVHSVIFLSWIIFVQGIKHSSSPLNNGFKKITHYIPNSHENDKNEKVNRHRQQNFHNKNLSQIDRNPSEIGRNSHRKSGDFSGSDLYWVSENSKMHFSESPSREMFNFESNSKGRSWKNSGGSKSTKDSSLPENPVGLQDPSLLTGLWEETPDIRETNAFFQGENGSVSTAQIGTTANISCIVLNREDHETVNWIRLRDHHLITVGRQTYSNDERFSVSFNRHRNEWTLHIRYAQTRDAGRYLCQLSTHPPLVFIRTLEITEASATIAGGPERIVEGGSVVNISCLLRDHSQQPEYVFWFHNRTMINFDTNRKVKVETSKDGSILTLVDVSLRDSGNYTCVPDKAFPASITLHVIRDDAPAAIQISCASLRPGNGFLSILTLSIFISIFCFTFSSSSSFFSSSS